MVWKLNYFYFVQFKNEAQKCFKLLKITTKQLPSFSLKFSKTTGHYHWHYHSQFTTHNRSCLKEHHTHLFALVCESMCVHAQLHTQILLKNKLLMMLESCTESSASLCYHIELLKTSLQSSGLEITGYV